MSKTETQLIDSQKKSPPRDQKCSSSSRRDLKAPTSESSGLTTYQSAESITSSTPTHLTVPGLNYNRTPSNPELRRRCQSSYHLPSRSRSYASLSNFKYMSNTPTAKPLQIDISNRRIYLPPRRQDGASTVIIHRNATSNVSFLPTNRAEFQPTETKLVASAPMKIPVMTPSRIFSHLTHEIRTSEVAVDGSNDDAEGRRTVTRIDGGSARLQEIPEREFQRLVRGIRKRARRPPVQILSTENLVGNLTSRSVRRDRYLRVASPSKDPVSSQPKVHYAPTVGKLAPAAVTIANLDGEGGDVLEEVSLQDTIPPTDKKVRCPWLFCF